MRATALLLALALAGCIGNGTETGNPGAKPKTTTAQLGLTAFSSDPAAVTLPAPTGQEQNNGPVQIDEAWVSVHKVELVRQANCDGAEETSLEIQNLVGDLAQGPLVSSLRVPATGYCKVKVEIQKPEDGAGPNPMGQNTIQISGLRADGTPFDLVTRRGFQMELRSRGTAFSIDAAHDALLVAFNVRRWFKDVALDQAQVDGGGNGAHIQIDDHHNPTLLQAFENAVSLSLGVYRDGNEDGHLDDGERDPVAGERGDE